MTESVRRPRARRPRGWASAVVLAVAAAAALAGLTATAAPVSAAPTCPVQSLKTQIKQADVVFRGVVQSVRPVHGKGTHRIQTSKVKADRVYRGSLVTDTVVVTAPVGAACPPAALTKGARYIFFATEDGSRLVATDATARATHRLTNQVIAKLGNGAQPKPAPPAHATFTKVADAAPPRLSRLLAPGAALLLISLLGLVFVGRLGRRTA